MPPLTLVLTVSPVILREAIEDSSTPTRGRVSLGRPLSRSLRSSALNGEPPLTSGCRLRSLATRRSSDTDLGRTELLDLRDGMLADVTDGVPRATGQTVSPAALLFEQGHPRAHLVVGRVRVHSIFHESPEVVSGG